MVQQLYTPSRLIKYPETDGQPMTESDATRNYMSYCITALQAFFQSRPQVYVSGNLFIYYEEGNPRPKYVTRRVCCFWCEQARAP